MVVRKNSTIKMGSDRNFGFTFSLVFLVIAVWPIIFGDKIKNWSLITSIILFFITLIKPTLLNFFNKIWFKFGLMLGGIASPLIMGIIFFFVVTPIGMAMKIFGKDLLRKKIDKKINSYWIKREKILESMKKQF